MQELEEKRYWIWFSMIEDIGIKRKIKLLQAINRSTCLIELDQIQKKLSL